MIKSLESPVSLRRRKILAIHLYEEHKFVDLLRRIKPLLALADEIWISSANHQLLENASNSELLSGRVPRCFLVDNKWHDWSGYLAFLQELDSSSCLIICNDSVVTRRVISNGTMSRFLGALEYDLPAIIGELDSAACSVDLNGWSSACWISTYLFAIQGVDLDVPEFVKAVERDVEKAVANPTHYFNQYLEERRAKVLVDVVSRRAKLGAMFFERRLSRLAIESGAVVINSFAGGYMRKVERLLERLRDA